MFDLNMPRRRNRGGRRVRRRNPMFNNRSFMRMPHFTELITFSLQLGSSFSLTKALLTGLPPRRNWRPISIVAQATAAYIPSSSGFTGSWAPSALLLQLTEIAASVSTSHTRILGSNPRTVHCYYPTSQDWLTYALTDEYQFGIVEAICLGNPGVTAYIRGLLRITVAFQPETLTPSCPSAAYETDVTSLEAEFQQMSLMQTSRIKSRIPVPIKGTTRRRR